MPEPSNLQTLFTPPAPFEPSQQLEFAFTEKIPPSGNRTLPHRLPTPLHDWPLSQRPPAHITLPLGLLPPPQHSWAMLQVVPVSRQPVAGKHTVAPLPGSEQMRVQQVLPPAQGLPLGVHPPPPPPVMSKQRPTPPSFAVQALLQHSELNAQRSSVAWQLYACAQKPPEQLVEQQSASSVQAWPTTLHVAPASAAQNPPVQVREQQAPGELQNAPVSAHAVPEHVPPMHVVPQQSALVVHASPVPAQ